MTFLATVDSRRMLCVAAGANSIFRGDKLTTAMPQAERDRALFERLDLRAQGDAPR